MGTIQQCHRSKGYRATRAEKRVNAKDTQIRNPTERKSILIPPRG